MESKEIDFLSIDQNRVTYEVELWAGGDCDSHFFYSKRAAIAYFDRHASHTSDCVKMHEPYFLGGETSIIKEAK